MKPSENKRDIGLFQYFILVFSAVGSGPAAIEGIIGAVGISGALIALAVFPLVWGLIQALVSLELALKYVDSDGIVCAWCRGLFSEALALNAGWLEVLYQVPLLWLLLSKQSYITK